MGVGLLPGWHDTGSSGSCDKPRCDTLVFFFPLFFHQLFFHNVYKITSHGTLVPPPSPSPRSLTTHALGWNWNAAPFAAEACRNFTPPSFHRFLIPFFLLLFAVVSFLFTASLVSLFFCFFFCLLLNWLARLPRGKCHSGRACQV